MFRERAGGWPLRAVVLGGAVFVAITALGPPTRAQGQPPESSPYRDRDRNRIFDDFDGRLAGQPGNAGFPVVAVFNRPLDERGYRDLARRIGRFTTKYRYSAISGMAATLTKGQILGLARQPETLQIEYDAEARALLNTATESFGANKARLDLGVDGNADGLASYSKNDVVVAVIDTGIDAAHVDLDGGKVIAFKDVVNAKTVAYDDHGHGTHVASIATGEGQGNPALKGVAPGAALVGVKVLNRRGSGTVSGVNAGIDWTINNKTIYGIEVLNMSLGISGCSDGADSTSLLVDRAVANGIVAAVSAGNEGPARCTIGSPAASRGAIAVGAMADTGEKGFYLASFSSRGPTLDGRIKPDIASPGVSINAAAAGTGSGYTVKSGTSMASPFIAGIAALMLDADPSLLPSGTPTNGSGPLTSETNPIKDKIRSTALDWSSAGADVDYGAGRLDGYEAVDAASVLNGTGPAVPGHLYKSDSLGGANSEDFHDIVVTSTTHPVAITMIMTNWSSSTNPDFDMVLKDPNGTQVASSLGIKRQETIAILPSITGTYKLRVYIYTGSGSYFFDVSAALGAAGPAAPTNLNATAKASGQIDLNWTASSGPNLAGYNVYRSTTSGFTPSAANKVASLVASTSYSDPGANTVDGTPYFYVVRAQDTSGAESPNSNQASAIADKTAPVAPSGLVILAGSGWNQNFVAVANAAAAKVSGTKSSDTVKLTISLTQDANAKTRVLSGLGSGTSFSDSVGVDTAAPTAFVDGPISVSATAEDAAGNVSLASAPLTVTRDTLRPPDPTGASVPAGSGNAVNVINSSNASSVGVSVSFASPPEAGTVTAILQDSFSASASGSAPANTAGSITSVTGVNASALADGSVAVRASIVDLAGNANASGEVTGSSATKDTISPAVSPTLSPPPGQTAVKDNDTVTFGGSTESGASLVTAAVRVFDGGGALLSELDSTANVAISGAGAISGSRNVGTLPAGAASLRFVLTVKDSAGNQATGTSSPLSVDNGSPSITSVTISPPAGQTAVKAGDTVSVLVKADSNSSNSASVDATAFGAGSISPSAVGGSSTDFSGTFVVAAGATEGSKTVAATVTRTSNAKTAGGTSNALTIDNTAPTGSVLINSGATYTGSTSVTLALSASDGSGVPEMRLANEAPPAGAYEPFAASKAWVLSSGDGTRTVYAQFRDAAGNQSAVASDTIVLDTTAPTLGSLSDSPDPFSPGASAGVKDSTTISATVSDANPGTWSVVVKQGVTTVRTFSGSGTSISAIWDGKNGSGVLVAEDTYSYEVSATDAAGNPSATATGTVTIDNTAPAVSSTSPAGGATGVAVATTVNATFNESMDPATISTSTFTLRETVSGTLVSGSVAYDSVTKTATLTPAATLAAGTSYTAEVTTGASDLAGNGLSSAHTWSFTTAAPDTTTPDTAISTPSGGATLTGSSATTTGTATDNVAVFKVEVAIRDAAGNYWNGSGFAGSTPIWNAATITSGANTTSANWSYNWTPLPSSDKGSFTIDARATDTASNIDPAPASVSVFVDNTAPTGSVLINSGATYTGSTSVTLALSASDGSGVPEMRLSNETPPAGAYEPFAASKAWVLSSGDGTRTVYAQFRDAAGNQSAVASDTIILDTTAPTLGSLSDSPDPFSPGASAGVKDSTTISATVSDANHGTWSVVIKQGLTTIRTFSGSGTSISAIWDGKNGSGVLVAEDTYTYEVSATDAAGNSSVTATGTVTIDNTAPSVSSTSPAGGATGVAADAIVTLAFSEANAMDATTVVNTGSEATSTLFLKTGATWVAASVSFDPATKIATLTPSAPLAASTTYTATATSGILDAAGNPFAGLSWSFTTAGATPRTWISGDLEGAVFSKSGHVKHTDAFRDYTTGKPGSVTDLTSVRVIVRVATYSSAGSSALGDPPPFVEAWTASGGSALNLIGSVTPGGPGYFFFTSSTSAVLTDLAGGAQVRIWIKSADKKGPVADLVEVDQVDIDLSYLSAASDTTAPAAPGFLTATVSGGQVTLEWGTVIDSLFGYKVYRKVETSGTYEAIATIVGGVTYTDAVAPPGSTYFYKVSAVDASGNEGPASPEASAAP